MNRLIGMPELLNPALADVVALCLSYALELAFFKKVKINSQERKCWSQADHT